MAMSETEARRIGEIVLSKLGPNWKCHVHENLGWWVGWQNGAVSLHYEEKTAEFWAMVGPIGSGVGSSELTPRGCAHCKTPGQAIREAIAFAWEADKERRAIMESCTVVLLDVIKNQVK
jgi:hypothetical protein